MPSDLIGSVEAAELLGVDRSVLTRLVQSGKLARAHKLPGENGAALYNRSDVEALAATRTEAAS
jgi:excisionase family DNA binding protein